MANENGVQFGGTKKTTKVAAATTVVGGSANELLDTTNENVFGCR